MFYRIVDGEIYITVFEHISVVREQIEEKNHRYRAFYKLSEVQKIIKALKSKDNIGWESYELENDLMMASIITVSSNKIKRASKFFWFVSQISKLNEMRKVLCN